MSPPVTAPFFRLVVGLGNPGREYAQTRHNVGFMIADRLAERAGVRFREEKRWQAEVAKAGEVLICKPLTFMNESGVAARNLAGFYKVPPEQTLVVLDDLALPLGTLRLRAQGSAGGQRGLQSVLEQLGTTAVPRLRVGIGSAQAGGAVEHVLGRFSKQEQAALDEALDRAEKAIACACQQGLAAAMNIFNSPTTTNQP